VAEPVPRRSNRANLGLNGRDVQLDQLGERLAASTRQKKRHFVPEDGLILEDNALAPVPKKKQRSRARTIPSSSSTSPTDYFTEETTARSPPI
jgi:hypothetical protein